MSKKILSTFIAFFIFSTSVNAETGINSDTTQNEVKIGSDLENISAILLGVAAGLSIYIAAYPFLGSFIFSRDDNSPSKGSLGLKAEINTIKINSKNTLDKGVGGIIGLNFQAENKIERFTEKEYLLVTEITPSLIFKKGEVIALLYDAGIGYKKEKLLGFLDAAILVGASAGIPYSYSNNLTIPKQPKTSDGKEGSLFGGGCFARAEIGVNPLGFIGNKFLTITLSLGYRFFNAKDAIGINSINSDIKVSF